MTYLSLDVETRLMTPGCQAPPLACISLALPGGWTDLLDGTPASVNAALCLMETPGYVTIGHTIAFDMAVLAANGDARTFQRIVALYESDKITCTYLRERLLDTAKGRNTKRGYALSDLVRRRFRVELDKSEDTWRKRYGELIGVPVGSWPEAARRYAIDDARYTLAIGEAQDADNYPAYLIDQFRQARGACWLQLMRTWGVRTSAEGVAELERVTRLRLAELEEEMRACGFLRPNRVLKSGPRKGQVEPGTKDMKRVKDSIVAAYAKLGRTFKHRFLKDAFGNPLMTPYPASKTGLPETSGDACEESDDPSLLKFADFAQLSKVLDEDVPALSGGFIDPIHPRITPLLETGRVSMSAPNLQNRSRQIKGAIAKLPDICACVVPREGHVFITADFGSLELCCLAQTCIDLLGYSTLADMLNGDIDPLTKIASEELLGIPYDEGKRRRKLEKSDPLRKDFELKRQSSKVILYGFPGGMGPATLVHFARKSYGVRVTEEEARGFKDVWYRTLPEMRDYQKLMGQLVEAPGAIMTLPRSRRTRGHCTYSQMSNSFFQGPGSDVAKEAGWRIMRQCYMGPGPLLGWRTCNFIHDDFVLEGKPTYAPEAAEELSRVMVEGAKVWLPDVKIKAPPLVSSVWSHKAEPVRDANGRLVCWYPEGRAA